MRFLKVMGGWLLLLLLFAVVVHYGLRMHLFTVFPQNPVQYKSQAK
ncbi:hypothetical protein AB2V43_004457 [Salmonella enterica]